MYGSTVLVTCKQCGKKAPSNEFILDPVYRMMVCRNCSRDRQSKAAGPARPPAQAKPPAPEISRPAGWDHDDESLVKIDRYKKQAASNVIRISPDKVKYKCSRCGFAFIYNTDKHYPTNCPNCGTRAEIKVR